MRRLTAALMMLASAMTPAWAADTPDRTPAGPTMSHEMMVGLARLQMTPEQARQFGQILQSITSDQLDMARKELRRAKPGVDRVIKKKTRRIINKHDKQMQRVLTREQLALYNDEVKSTLYDELTRPPRRDEGQRTTYESREGSGVSGGCTWC